MVSRKRRRRCLHRREGCPALRRATETEELFRETRSDKVCARCFPLGRAARSKSRMVESEDAAALGYGHFPPSTSSPLEPMLVCGCSHAQGLSQLYKDGGAWGLSTHCCKGGRRPPTWKPRRSLDMTASSVRLPVPFLSGRTVAEVGQTLARAISGCLNCASSRLHTLAMTGGWLGTGATIMPVQC